MKLLLQNKNIKHIGYLFLESAYKYINISLPSKDIHLKISFQLVRIFYSYSLIVFYTKQTIGDHRKRLPSAKKLIKEAVNLFVCLKNLNDEPIYKHKFILYNFLKQLMIYKNIFLEWKEDDKKQLAQNITINYWELEIVKYGNFDCASRKLQIIEDMIAKQKEMIHDLNFLGSDCQEIFNTYVPFEHIYHFKTVNKSLLYMIYWNKMMEEITEEKPYNLTKIKYFMECLKTKICDILQICQLKVELKEFIFSQMTEYFDIDFICSMINNDVYKVKEAKLFINFLFKILLYLDTPYNDKGNKNVNDKLNECFECIQKKNIPLIFKIIECWILIVEHIIPIFNSLYELVYLYLKQKK